MTANKTTSVQITIVETISGNTERKVYHIFKGDKFISQFSDLKSASIAYPNAKVDLMD